ncbi:MAG: aldo/keto reductase [Clostridia bacterium]|jgi:predicted aldo/keto reductase-like oxidoreductase|nr:aldo/keto reductase [Clostridia bacterium]
MYYNELNGLKVSALGLGNMRLPKVEGQGEKIDREKAQEIVDYAMSHGITYFDTAYRYHGGESELFLGEAMKKYPRGSYLLASKFPGHMMEKKENGMMGFTSLLAGHPDTTVDALFHEQLRKCQTDYFDFYLLHNVSEKSLVFYNDPEIGIVDYLLEQKRQGKIRHLGFSSHAVSAETIDDFLKRYEGVFEFVQIQLNYMDWKIQNAKAKVEVIARHGLKIVVMEGVRGGRLANLPAPQMEKLQAVRPADSAARWALRWLQGIPEVAVVLSGMSTLDQIVENVETFREPNPVSPAEKELLQEVAESMLSWVPCTACRYCTEGCPMELDIPRMIAAYNGLKNGDHMAGYQPDEAQPSMDPRRCIGCGSCASICPQNIRIPEILQELAQMLTK